jgi:hypothetical protein
MRGSGIPAAAVAIWHSLSRNVTACNWHDWYGTAMLNLNGSVADSFVPRLQLVVGQQFYH